VLAHLAERSDRSSAVADGPILPAWRAETIRGSGEKITRKEYDVAVEAAEAARIPERFLQEL